MEGHDTTVAKGATSIYLSNVIILGMNTIYFIIIANLLSTTEIGIVAGMQLLIFGISTLTNFSLPQIIPSNIMIPQTLAKIIPEFLGKGEHGKAVRSFLIVFITALIVATTLSLILYIYADTVSEFIFRGEAPISWIHLLSFDVFLFSISQLFYGGLVGLKRIPRASLILIISFGVRYILGASAVIAGYSIYGLLISFIIGDLIFLIPASFSSIKPLWSKQEDVPIKFIYDYSLPLLVTSIIIFGVTQLDKIFALLQLELSDLGIYNVAVTASTIGAFAPNAITTALVPTLSTLESTNMIDSFKELSKEYTRYIALIATPMSFGVASLASGLIQLFGPQYVAGAFPATIISLATGITVVSSVYNGELLATRRTKSIMLVNLIGVIILAGCLIVLTPVMQFVGVAWSRSIMTISIALMLAYVAIRHRLFVIDFIAFRDSLLSSSIMGIILYFALESISGYSQKLISLALFIPSGIVIYLAILRILKTFNSKDIEFIRTLLPKKIEWLAKIVSKIVGVK